ncbi:MAG: hypothetical protein GY951_12630 [Psychromonas sp.]|nr:hypothetical protein [Alteromonadales bacterium]MCP5078886.1 hypothetical protein [Psychromonas sp.]
MELALKLYIHHKQTKIVLALNDLLAGLSLSGDRVVEFLQQYNNALVDTELTPLEFDDVYCNNGWLVADFILPNGDEPELLPWLTLFHQAIPELDVRFSGEGEPESFLFLRYQDGSPELLQCEEEEIEELLSYQEWFNEGLPEALQLNYL